MDPESQQWVELYNKGQVAIDLSGWFIDDSGGSQKFTIPLGTFINPLEFIVFESSYFNLNRTSPDTVQLINNTSVEDSFAYNAGPGSNSSYGRQTDGTGSWVIFGSPTKGSSNNTAVSVPTATPTISPSLTPTNVPTPTKTPTPTSTSKPTATPKVTQTPTSTPLPTIKVATPTVAKITTQESLDQKEDNSPTSILVEAQSVPVSTQSSSMATDVLGSKTEKAFFNFSTLSIGIGFIFLTGSGILAFRKWREMQNDYT